MPGSAWAGKAGVELIRPTCRTPTARRPSHGSDRPGGARDEFPRGRKRLSAAVEGRGRQLGGDRGGPEVDPAQAGRHTAAPPPPMSVRSGPWLWPPRATPGYGQVAAVLTGPAFARRAAGNGQEPRSAAWYSAPKRSRRRSRRAVSCSFPAADHARREYCCRVGAEALSRTSRPRLGAKTHPASGSGGRWRPETKPRKCRHGKMGLRARAWLSLEGMTTTYGSAFSVLLSPGTARGRRLFPTISAAFRARWRSAIAAFALRLRLRAQAERARPGPRFRGRVGQ